ncbi:hypothetical protein GG344DRAFT_66799 [Lentinula edodes]|nr:hypothetical protein GG344DRAFT_66799 [Lentinula edodes]
MSENTPVTLLYCFRSTAITNIKNLNGYHNNPLLKPLAEKFQLFLQTKSNYPSWKISPLTEQVFPKGIPTPLKKLYPTSIHTLIHLAKVASRKHSNEESAPPLEPSEHHNIQKLFHSAHNTANAKRGLNLIFNVEIAALHLAMIHTGMFEIAGQYDTFMQTCCDKFGQLPPLVVAAQLGPNRPLSLQEIEKFMWGKLFKVAEGTLSASEMISESLQKIQDIGGISAEVETFFQLTATHERAMDKSPSINDPAPLTPPFTPQMKEVMDNPSTRSFSSSTGKDLSLNSISGPPNSNIGSASPGTLTTIPSPTSDEMDVDTDIDKIPLFMPTSPEEDSAEPTTTPGEDRSATNDGKAEYYPNLNLQTDTFLQARVMGDARVIGKRKFFQAAVVKAIGIVETQGLQDKSQLEEEEAESSQKPKKRRGTALLKTKKKKSKRKHNSDSDIEDDDDEEYQSSKKNSIIEDNQEKETTVSKPLPFTDEVGILHTSTKLVKDAPADLAGLPYQFQSTKKGHVKLYEELVEAASMQKSSESVKELPVHQFNNFSEFNDGQKQALLSSHHMVVRDWDPTKGLKFDLPCLEHCFGARQSTSTVFEESLHTITTGHSFAAILHMATESPQRTIKSIKLALPISLFPIPPGISCNTGTQTGYTILYLDVGALRSHVIPYLFNFHTLDDIINFLMLYNIIQLSSVLDPCRYLENQSIKGKYKHYQTAANLVMSAKWLVAHAKTFVVQVVQAENFPHYMQVEYSPQQVFHAICDDFEDNADFQRFWGASEEEGDVYFWEAQWKKDFNTYKFPSRAFSYLSLHCFKIVIPKIDNGLFLCPGNPWLDCDFQGNPMEVYSHMTSVHAQEIKGTQAFSGARPERDCMSFAYCVLVPFPLFMSNINIIFLILFSQPPYPTYSQAKTDSVHILEPHIHLASPAPTYCSTSVTPARPLCSFPTIKIPACPSITPPPFYDPDLMYATGICANYNSTALHKLRPDPLIAFSAIPSRVLEEHGGTRGILKKLCFLLLEASQGCIYHKALNLPDQCCGDGQLYSCSGPMGRGNNHFFLIFRRALQAPDDLCPDCWTSGSPEWTLHNSSHCRSSWEDVMQGLPYIIWRIDSYRKAVFSSLEAWQLTQRFTSTVDYCYWLKLPATNPPTLLLNLHVLVYAFLQLRRQDSLPEEGLVFNGQ